MKIVISLLFICFSLLVVQAQDIEVKELSVNSKQNDEFAPFVKDSVLYFVSNKKQSVIKSVVDQNEEYLFKIYYSNIKNEGKLSKPKLFLPEIQSPLNNGGVTISQDGQILFITRSQVENVKKALRSGGDKLGVFQLNKEGTSWSSNIQSLSFNGTVEYSTGQASISADGKYLYFSSDMNKGYGKADIYVSEKDGESWSEPVNIGKLINTPGNELFPYMHSSGKLYFASDGLRGRGGLDIFVTVKQENGWSEPVALEEPINSEFDDYACFVLDNEEEGYFASNRNNSDDLFYYKQLFPKFEFCMPQKIDKYCFTLFENGPYDSDTVPYIYKWNFGDGESGIGLKVKHCFPGPGFYKIRLNAVDTLLNTELMTVAEHDVTLKKTEQVFITCPDTVKVGETIHLNASESFFKNLTPKDYYWTFEDGKKEKGETIIHIFRKTGKQNVVCGTIDVNNSVIKYCSSKEIVVIE